MELKSSEANSLEAELGGSLLEDKLVIVEGDIPERR